LFAHIKESDVAADTTGPQRGSRGAHAVHVCDVQEEHDPYSEEIRPQSRNVQHDEYEPQNIEEVTALEDTVREGAELSKHSSNKHEKDDDKKEIAANSIARCS